MADGLEEPILSTLGRPVNAGATFMNAFYAASQMNLRKRQLEEQLTKMQMQMGLNEQKHMLDMDKFERDSYFKQANLTRAYDLMQQNAVFADRRAQDAEDKANWNMARADAKESDATALRRELTEAAGKNPIWSQAFQNDMLAIKSKYDTGTAQSQRVIRDFNSDIYRSTKEAHANAGLAMRAFNTSLGMQGGSGLTKQDMQRPIEDFVIDKGNIGIPERPVTVPGPAGQPAQLRWQAIPPAELKKMTMEQQTKAGIRWRRTTKENYDNLKSLHDQISKYGGSDLGEKPAVFTNPLPLPQSKDQLVQDQIYQTNKGRARWNGSMFEPEE